MRIPVIVMNYPRVHLAGGGDPIDEAAGLGGGAGGAAGGDGLPSSRGSGGDVLGNVTLVEHYHRRSVASQESFHFRWGR